MSPDDFRQYLESNYLAFDKWGTHVAEKIVEMLFEKLGYKPVPQFVKISPLPPRVKEVSSAMGKVGRKNYDDPIKQMTDLVGVRFVVLLSEHIEVVSRIVNAEESWRVVTSRDFQEEIEKNPKLFDYQSQHFEVRPRDDLSLDGTLVTKDMCCEIQIRTLLQHAYAELVHDSIYKLVGQVPPKAVRQVAKSMALMETTDELFCNTMQILTDANKPRNDFYDDLVAIFRQKVGGHFLKPDQKTNLAILDEFREIFRDGLSADVAHTLDVKKYISIKITRRAATSPFFAQPVSLFVYWLVLEIGPDNVHSRWPLPGYWRELNLIFSDLDSMPSHS